MLRRFALPLLLLLVSSVYLYTASSRALLDDGDALYAHVARQMIARDDWVTPYANGVRFLDKPPMMYWLMAASFSAFGVSEWSARLPSVLAVLGIALLVYDMGRRAAGRSAGLAGGVASAFCVGTFLFTRMVFPDILFVFFVTLAVFAFLRWRLSEGKATAPALLFYAALAAAVLTKGMIGLVFPVGAVVLYLLWAGEWKCLRRFHPVKGAILFLALALPWHLAAAWRNPGFLWYFFVNEQILRFLGRRVPADYESISLPVFWLLILVWFFPWSAFLPAVVRLFRTGGSRAGACGAVAGLSAAWAALVLVFFSFSSRIEHYALPILPPLALLAGIALAAEIPSESGEAGWRRNVLVDRGFAFLAALGAAAGAGGVVLAYFVFARNRGGAPGEAAVHHMRAYSYYFAPLLDLPPETLAGLEMPALGAAAVLFAGLTGAWWWNRRKGRMQAVLALAGTMAAFCLLSFVSLGVCEDALTSKGFAQVLDDSEPGASVVVLGDYETANSLNFYSPLPVLALDGRAAVLEWGLGYPDAPRRVLSRKEFDLLWRGPHRVFLLAPDRRIAGLGLDRMFPVFRSSGRTLLCNREESP